MTSNTEKITTLPDRLDNNIVKDYGFRGRVTEWVTPEGDKLPLHIYMSGYVGRADYLTDTNGRIAELSGHVTNLIDQALKQEDEASVKLRHTLETIKQKGQSSRVAFIAASFSSGEIKIKKPGDNISTVPSSEVFQDLAKSGYDMVVIMGGEKVNTYLEDSILSTPEVPLPILFSKYDRTEEGVPTYLDIEDKPDYTPHLSDVQKLVSELRISTEQKRNKLPLLERLRKYWRLRMIELAKEYQGGDEATEIIEVEDNEDGENDGGLVVTLSFDVTRRPNTVVAGKGEQALRIRTRK